VVSSADEYLLTTESHDGWEYDAWLIATEGLEVEHDVRNAKDQGFIVC